MKPQSVAATTEPWPELPWREWKSTITTLHMWLQVVGKVRMALSAPLNHWWHTTLYLTSRGLTTSPIPIDGRHFQVDFDFIDHRLDVSDTEGRTFAMTLEPRSVATFYRDFMAGLRELGIEVRIWTMPVEVAYPIPFELDDQHASYEPMQAQLFWRALLRADRMLKQFQTGFVGKMSPVHLFWGGLDLASSRYSGRPAPLHPGGIPNTADWRTRKRIPVRNSRPAGGPRPILPAPPSTRTPIRSPMGSGPRIFAPRRHSGMSESASSP